MAFGFGAPLGVLAFLFLIPLILLYLIKPKTVNLAVPSLSFFSSRTRFKKSYSFLRYFMKDLLFLLQLLVLLFLAFSLTEPWFVQEKDVVTSNLVFVLDVSASSQALDSFGKTRFSLALDEIEKLAGEQNTLVLARSSPVIALRDANKEELLRFLSHLRPSDTGTDLGSALLLAGDLLDGSKGRVLVLSDFIHTSGMNPLTAKNILETKDIPVDFLDVGDPGVANIGFIHFLPGSSLSHAYIKNFNSPQEDFTLLVDGVAHSLSLSQGDIEDFSFVSPDYPVELLLEVDDALDVDDHLYFSGSGGSFLKVLLLQSGENSFLESALRSFSRVELTIAEPPVFDANAFDVVVVGDVDKGKFLPGWSRELSKYAKEGGSLVLTMHSESFSFDYGSLLSFEDDVQEYGEVFVDQVSSFTQDLDLGSVNRYFTLEGDAYRSLASVSGEETLLGIREEGKGKIFYYGILDSESDFPFSPSYPLFWINLVKYLSDYKDLNDLNLQAGVVLDAEQGLVLDRSGFYEFNDDKIAVNLLNEMESDLSFVSENDDSLDSVSVKDFSLEPVVQEVFTDLRLPLLVLIVLLVFFELYYIKRRGEI